MPKYLVSQLNAEDQHKISEVASSITLDKATLNVPSLPSENKIQNSGIAAMVKAITEAEENIEHINTHLIPEQRRKMQGAEEETLALLVAKVDKYNQKIEEEKLALQEKITELNQLLKGYLDKTVETGLSFYGAALDPALLNQPSVIAHAVLGAFSPEREAQGSYELANIQDLHAWFKALHHKGTNYARALHTYLGDTENMSDSELDMIVNVMKAQVQKRIAQEIFKKLRVTLDAIENGPLSPTEKSINILLAYRFAQDAMMMGNNSLSADEIKRFETDYSDEIKKAQDNLNTTLRSLNKNLLELTESTLEDPDSALNTQEYILNKIIPTLLMLRRSGLVNEAESKQAAFDALKNINTAIGKVLEEIAKHPSDKKLIAHLNDLYKFRDEMIVRTELGETETLAIHVDFLERTHESSKKVRDQMPDPPKVAAVDFRVILQLATAGNSNQSMNILDRNFAKENREEVVAPYLRAAEGYLNAIRIDASGNSADAKLQEHVKKIFEQEQFLYDIIQLSGNVSANAEAIELFANEILSKIGMILNKIDLTTTSLENTVAAINSFVFFKNIAEKSNLLKAAGNNERKQFLDKLKTMQDQINGLIMQFEGRVLENIITEFATSKVYFITGDTYILSDKFKEYVSILKNLNDEKLTGTEPCDFKNQLVNKFKRQFDTILATKGILEDISYKQIEDFVSALDLISRALVLDRNEILQITDYVQNATFKAVDKRKIIMDYLAQYHTQNPGVQISFSRLDAYRSAAFGEPIKIELTSLEMLGTSIENLNEKLNKKELKEFSNLFKPGLTSVTIEINSKAITEAQLALLKALIATALNANPLLTVSVYLVQVNPQLHQAEINLNEILKARNSDRQKIALEIDRIFDKSANIKQFIEECAITGFDENDKKKLYLAQLLAKEPNPTAESLIQRLGTDDEKVLGNLSLISKNDQNAKLFLMMGLHYQTLAPKLAVKYLQLIPNKSDLYPVALLEIVKSGQLETCIGAATLLLAYDRNSPTEDSGPRAQVVIVNLLRLAADATEVEATQILTVLTTDLDRRKAEGFGAHNIEALKILLTKKLGTLLSSSQSDLVKNILSMTGIERPYELLSDATQRSYAETISHSDYSLTGHDTVLLTNQIELLFRFDQPADAIKLRLDALVSQKADPTQIIQSFVDKLINSKMPLSKNQIEILVYLVKHHSKSMLDKPELFIKNIATLADNLVKNNNPEAGLQVIEHTIAALPQEMRETSLSNNYYLIMKPLRDLLKSYEIAGNNRTTESVAKFFKSIVADDDELKKMADYQWKANIIASANVHNLSTRVSRIKTDASNMRSQTGAGKATVVADTLKQAADVFTVTRSRSNSPRSRSNTQASNIIDDDYDLADDVDAEATNTSVADQNKIPSDETAVFIKLFGIAAAGNIQRAVSRPDPQNPKKKDFSHAMKELAALESALNELESMIAEKSAQGNFERLKQTFNNAFQASSSRTGENANALLGHNCKLPGGLNSVDKQAIMTMITELRACITQKQMILKSEAANLGISNFLAYFDKKSKAAYEQYREPNAPASQKSKATEKLYTTQTKSINLIKLLGLVLELRNALKHPDADRDAIINQYKSAFNEWRHSDLDEAPGRVHHTSSSFAKSLKHATAMITGRDVECKQLQEAIEVDSLIALAESDLNLQPTLDHLNNFKVKDITKDETLDDLKKTFDDTVAYFSDMGSKAMKYITSLTGGDTREKAAEVIERHKQGSSPDKK